MTDAERIADCTNELREQGKAYPRTCKRCGLGPCQTRPFVPPKTDAQTIAELQATLVAAQRALAEERQRVQNRKEQIERLLEQQGHLIDGEQEQRQRAEQAERDHIEGMAAHKKEVDYAQRALAEAERKLAVSQRTVSDERAEAERCSAYVHRRIEKAERELAAANRRAEALVCESVINTQRVVNGRLVCDSEEFLIYFNARKPRAPAENATDEREGWRHG